MKRRLRTRILIDGSPDLLRRLSAEAESSHDVRDVDDPSGGLVMMRLRDTARKDAFYLGEILVTEAKVRIGGTLGLGLIRGDRPEEARRLAVVDAAFNANSPLIADWIPLLEEEDLRIVREKSREAAEILKTRVDFSTMESF